MRLTFKVLFCLRRNAPKKNGFVPVIYRNYYKWQSIPIQLQTGCGGKIVECRIG